MPPIKFSGGFNPSPQNIPLNNDNREGGAKGKAAYTASQLAGQLSQQLTGLQQSENRFKSIDHKYQQALKQQEEEYERKQQHIADLGAKNDISNYTLDWKGKLAYFTSSDKFNLDALNQTFEDMKTAIPEQDWYKHNPVQGELYRKQFTLKGAEQMKRAADEGISQMLQLKINGFQSIMHVSTDKEIAQMYQSMGKDINALPISAYQKEELIRSSFGLLAKDQLSLDEGRYGARGTYNKLIETDKNGNPKNYHMLEHRPKQISVYKGRAENEDTANREKNIVKLVESIGPISPWQMQKKIETDNNLKKLSYKDKVDILEASTKYRKEVDDNPVAYTKGKLGIGSIDDSLEAQYQIGVSHPKILENSKAASIGYELGLKSSKQEKIDYINNELAKDPEIGDKLSAIFQELPHINQIEKLAARFITEPANEAVGNRLFDVAAIAQQDPKHKGYRLRKKENDIVKKNYDKNLGAFLLRNGQGEQYNEQLKIRMDYANYTNRSIDDVEKDLNGGTAYLMIDNINVSYDNTKNGFSGREIKKQINELRNNFKKYTKYQYTDAQIEDLKVNGTIKETYRGYQLFPPGSNIPLDPVIRIITQKDGKKMMSLNLPDSDFFKDER